MMMVTLIEASRYQCRTIDGDIDGPKTVVCGLPVLPGKSYCEACHARYFTRPVKVSLTVRKRTRRKQLFGLAQRPR